MSPRPGGDQGRVVCCRKVVSVVAGGRGTGARRKMDGTGGGCSVRGQVATASPPGTGLQWCGWELIPQGSVKGDRPGIKLWGCPLGPGLRGTSRSGRASKGSGGRGRGAVMGTRTKTHPSAGCSHPGAVCREHASQAPRASTRAQPSAKPVGIRELRKPGEAAPVCPPPPAVLSGNHRAPKSRGA